MESFSPFLSEEEEPLWLDDGGLIGQNFRRRDVFADNSNFYA